MKTKVIAFAVVMCLTLSAVGCSSDRPEDVAEQEPASGQVEPPTEETETVVVDESLLTVDVTLPAVYFEESTEEEIREGAKAQGYRNVVIHDNGSVTYTMSKAKHREMLVELKEGITESIEEMLEGPEAVASFRSITHDDDMSEFTVEVDRGLYSEWDAMYALVLYASGWVYQGFSGVAPADNRVVVTFVDSETGEVLNTADSADMQ